MLAVLIDAENAQPSVTEALMAEIAKFGIASVKRIYGDWTTSHLSGWKSIVLEYSIQPIQQFRYTVGKNATDSAMIIDAMDLLYTQRFNGFCLVSSDSDFTRLASRIREEGLSVYGFGEKKTPQAFVSACDKFIYTEVLRSEGYESSPDQARNTNDLKGDAKLVNILRRAVNATSDESGWALLSSVGASIAKQAPEFDPRNYGYTKLSELVSAIQLFEIDKRRVSESHSKIIYIRDQRKNRKEGLEQPTPVSMAHWARFIAKHKEGDVLQGTIGHIHFLGLFINLADLELTGLIHKSNLPDHFMTSFAVGQKLSVTIKEIRTDKHQIELLYRA
ncbi:Maebl [candidate division KSB3 bacterium]|uniref:Maebl n=1 Tax=candidate division KSB3 bacterium TaxID=2044937 RepID=A0A2G6E3Q9_9BACT|nr:MAG: Maebl [candidate division KSB3 bacterium]PIE29240.1 MAG: Maebl [candidate division KSB3 bacterium]